MNGATKKVLKYTMLPQILPMLRDLLKPGLGLVALSIAQIYAGCGLIPRHHAYLNHQNMGRFGIGNVIVEAGRNLKFTRNNIDQIVIYILSLTGMALLFSQIFIAGLVIFTQVAHAAMPANYSDLFVTAAPQDAGPDQDIAYILMDRVFGIPGLFDSCASVGNPCLNDPNPEIWPQPYHAALQDMLSFYSVGLCFIAFIIFIYYVIAILMETAETGTPFGRRYSHAWAPIRMVLALGLLIPLGGGLNSAQMLTLHMAKWGSSFATNGWVIFERSLVSGSGNIIGNTADLVGLPQSPEGASIFQFYTVVATCKKMYKKRFNIDIDAYLVKTGAAATNSLLTSNSWAQANTFYDNGDIVVVFGELDATKWNGDKGNVHPFCGEMVLPSVDVTDAGAMSIQTDYYQNILLAYWNNASSNIAIPGAVGAAPTLPAPNGRAEDFFFNAADREIEFSLGDINNPTNGLLAYPDAKEPDELARNYLLTTWQSDIPTYIGNALAAAQGDTWNSALERYGWAGAGIWYNKIAQLNGGFMAAVASLPSVRKWPLVMESISEEVSKITPDRADEDRFNPATPGEVVKTPPEVGMTKEMAIVLNNAYGLWGSGTAKEIDVAGYSVPPHASQNMLVDFLRWLFGTTGLYSMAQNTNIHPLAQIVIMGKNLLDASIRNLALGAGGGIIAKVTSGVPKDIAEIVASMFRPIGMMTLSIGFTLFYVVPFMPFLYFFFQVGGWIKGLFEAMVGVPLWALAHIRIDNDGGMAGQAALAGYWLILELFLRPILSIFGLIGSIAIFAAQVKVLNEIFAIVVTNVSGFDQANATAIASGQVGWYGYFRGYIDQFFYTIVYAVIVYMMGMSSFKLIYMIPDKTLRWMGGNVESFGDEIGRDAPEGLVGKMYGGSSAIAYQMDTGTSKAMANFNKR